MIDHRTVLARVATLSVPSTFAAREALRQEGIKLRDPERFAKVKRLAEATVHTFDDWLCASDAQLDRAIKRLENAP